MDELGGVDGKDCFRHLTGKSETEIKGMVSSVLLPMSAVIKVCKV